MRKKTVNTFVILLKLSRSFMVNEIQLTKVCGDSAVAIRPIRVLLL